MNLFDRNQLRNAVQTAIRKFGQHTYHNSAHEVMSLTPYVEWIKNATPEELRDISEALGAFSEEKDGFRFVADLISSVDDLDDERWIALTEDERVQRCY